MIDPIDARILHALQIAPRAPFRTIADAVGVGEQLVARRFHRLHRDGAVRIVGLAHPPGDAAWVVRIRARPDDLRRIADALIRRVDVTHANVHSNWTELVCVVRAPFGESGDGILQRLPRTSAVLGLDIDLILHTFGEPVTASWTAYGQGLPASRAAALLDSMPERQSTGIAITAEDGALFEALAEDGRVPHARIAAITGWSVARVARRLHALEAGGALVYDVDVLPRQLGFTANAMLWLRVAPRHVHDVGEAVAAHPEVASVSAISGADNLMVVVVSRDVEHLYRYLSEDLGRVPDVDGYRVSIRTERLKQTASLVSRGRLIAAR